MRTRTLVLSLALTIGAGCTAETEAPAKPESSAETQAKKTEPAKAPDQKNAESTEVSQEPGRGDPLPFYINNGNSTPRVDGFAVLAFDEVTGDLYTSVASRPPFSGAVAIDAEAGVGAVASLGLIGGDLCDEAMAALREGATAEETVQRVIRKSTTRLKRSLGVIDKQGRIAVHDAGVGYCGSHTNHGMLVMAFDSRFSHVLHELTGRYAQYPEVPVAERVYDVLHWAARTGSYTGKRGARSAALLCVREKGGPLGQSDRLIDVRVDFFENPTYRLGELLDIHMRSYTGPRLVSLNKVLADKENPIYKSNKTWLKRIRDQVPFGTRQ